MSQVESLLVTTQSVLEVMLLSLSPDRYAGPNRPATCSRDWTCLHLLNHLLAQLSQGFDARSRFKAGLFVQQASLMLSRHMLVTPFQPFRVTERPSKEKMKQLNLGSPRLCPTSRKSQMHHAGRPLLIRPEESRSSWLRSSKSFSLGRYAHDAS